MKNLLERSSRSTVNIDMEVSAVYEDIPTNNAFNDAEFLMPWDKYLSIREWVRNAGISGAIILFNCL